MILVTGANGHFGKETISFLLKNGIQPDKIAGLVRSDGKARELKERGIDVRIGDYEDYNSLLNAFAGIEKLLLVSGSDVVNRTRQHENVIKAAKATAIKHILYTSFERKNDSDTNPLGLVAKSHRDTEAMIKDSGIPYTLMLNNTYMEFIPMILGERVFEKGIFYPAGDGKTAFALRTEMAEAAANVIIGSGHENKSYHFSNSEGVSFGEIAEILSRITEKKVSYFSPDKQTYINTLVTAGVPKELATVFAAFGEAAREGELAPSIPDLELLLGRKPATVEQYLEKVYGSK